MWQITWSHRFLRLLRDGHCSAHFVFRMLPQSESNSGLGLVWSQQSGGPLGLPTLADSTYCPRIPAGEATLETPTPLRPKHVQVWLIFSLQKSQLQRQGCCHSNKVAFTDSASKLH